jgi:hypothetical protein
MSTRVWAVALLTVFFIDPALAQTNGSEADVSRRPAGVAARKAPYSLVVNHVDGSMSLYGTRGQLLEEWGRFSDSSPLADIPADRPINIVIEDANPLLYDYAVDALVIGREDLKACSDLGGRFLGQGFLLASAAVAGAAFPSFPVSGLSSGVLDVESAFANVLASRGAFAGATVSEAELEEQLASVRIQVSEFIEFAFDIAVLSESIEDSLSYFAARAESRPLSSMISAYQSRLEVTQRGLSDPTRTPWIVEERIRTAAPFVSTLNRLASAVTEGGYQGDIGSLEAREVVMLAEQVESGSQQLAGSYASLQVNLLKIERLKRRTRRVFSVGAGKGTIRRISIRTTSNGEMPQVLRLHEGDRDIFVRPRSTLLCEISVGMAWADPHAEYEIDSSDGTIKNSNQDDFRIATSLLLHVAASSVPFVAATMGLGVGKNSVPDFYLGGTLRLFQPVMINAGWTWQRRQQLPEGLRVGGAIDPLSDVLDDLDLEFRRAFFFGVSFSR